MASKYAWRMSGLNRASADVAGRICEELDNSAEGLSPETLLARARDEACPLHDEFEWDDTAAAEKYRLTQAQGIIRNLRVMLEVSEDEPQKVHRAFVCIHSADDAGNYKAMKRVLERPDWTEQMKRNAKAELTAFVYKYSGVKELKCVVDGVEGLIAANLKE